MPVAQTAAGTALLDICPGMWRLPARCLACSGPGPRPPQTAACSILISHFAVLQSPSVSGARAFVAASTGCAGTAAASETLPAHPAWRARGAVSQQAASGLRSVGGALLCAFLVAGVGAQSPSQTPAPPAQKPQAPPESIIVPGAPNPS